MLHGLDAKTETLYSTNRVSEGCDHRLMYLSCV